MKIKKFPQSCILIESNDTKILVDAGKTNYTSEFLKDWSKADVVLITHRHGDHIIPEVLKDFKQPIYSTAEVKQFCPNLNISIIKQGDAFNVGNINIQVVNAQHGYMVKVGEVKENVGFIINDGKTKLYVTSDTIRFDNDYKCDVLYANITAFDASMNLWGASQTYLETGAKLLIVAHQDTGKMIYRKEEIEQYLSSQNINFIIPETNEEIEI